jgi:hypothetical protein
MFQVSRGQAVEIVVCIIRRHFSHRLYKEAEEICCILVK